MRPDRRPPDKKKKITPPEQIAARKRAWAELGLAYQEPPKNMRSIKKPPEGGEPPHGEKRPAVSFDFNLDFDGKSAFGACACDGKVLVLVTGDTVSKHDLKELGEIKLNRAIGAVAIETVIDGEETELCRADMSLCRTFEDNVMRLENLRKGNELPKKEPHKCPKCGTYMVMKRGAKDTLFHVCTNETCRHRVQVENGGNDDAE